MIKRTFEQLKEANALNETILSNIPQMVLIVDSKFTVHSANNAFLEFFHFSRSEVLNLPLSELDGGKWWPPEMNATFLKRLESGDPVRHEYVHQFPKIGKKRMSVDARRVRSNSLYMMVFEALPDR